MKTVQTMIRENPSSSTHLNYIANLKEHLDKFYSHFAKNIYSTDNVNAAKSDLKTMGCICSDLLKDIHSLNGYLENL